jgi:hypothetical protein
MAPPSAKPVDPLDRQDARMVGLRLGFDVFTAVDQHLDDLFLADTSDQGPGFADLVRQISKECLEEQKFDHAKPLATHLTAIKTGFAAVPNKLAPLNPAFSPLIQEMSASLKTHTASQCRAGLEKMCLQGWQWFQDFIKQYGGSYAKVRLAEMLKIGPATLDIEVGQRDFTYCHYLEEKHRIQLLIGGTAGGLNLFFDLPFYFLHEYVSHAYAKWDDPRWRFSEAHLLQAAKHYLKEELRKNDRPRLPFLGQHFASIRGNADPNAQSDLQKAEDCNVEMYYIVRDRLITHLLEWATFPATDSEGQERNMLLSGFHALVKDPANLETAFGNPYSGFEKVDQRLNAMVRNALTIRKQRK